LTLLTTVNESVCTLNYVAIGFKMVC